MHLFEAAVELPDHQLARLAHQVLNRNEGGQVLFARQLWIHHLAPMIVRELDGRVHGDQRRPQRLIVQTVHDEAADIHQRDAHQGGRNLSHEAGGEGRRFAHRQFEQAADGDEDADPHVRHAEAQRQVFISRGSVVSRMFPANCPQ